MAAYKDYYRILGVSRLASDKEIRAAFRKSAAKYHPDKNPGDKSAEERFKEVNEAHTVLADPEKRKFYDRYGSASGPPPFSGARPGDFSWSEGGDFSDFFQNLFGNFGGTGFSTGRADPFAGFGESRVPRRQGVEGEIRVGLEEAYHGGSRTVSIGGRRVEVKLPQGTRDGSRLRLRGQAPGGGDVYLTVRLEPHPHYRPEGDDIRLVLKVPDYLAVLGGTVRVPTLDGDVNMTLPKGTQSGRVLRLRGKGWPRKDGSRGDALAEVRVVISENPTEAQLGLYQSLRELSEGKVPEAAD
jgi:curved DNA-binding protein